MGRSSDGRAVKSRRSLPDQEIASIAGHGGALRCPWAKYGCRMPSTTRLTVAAWPPASGCKCGPAAEGARCAATVAAAKSATVTIKPKRVAERCIISFPGNYLSDYFPLGHACLCVLQAPFHVVSGFGSNETEISQGRGRWQGCSRSLDQGPLASSIG